MTLGDRVMTTSKYDLFKEHRVNRTIQEGTATFHKLEASMLRDGWRPTEPMTTYPKGPDGLYEIVRGHTRFHIARKHGIPIKFQVDDMKLPIHETEDGGGKPTWTLKDWVTSHARDNKNPNYQILMEFHHKTKIPMSSCIQLFNIGGSGGSGDVERGCNHGIKNGSFSIPNPAHAEAVGNLIMYCTQLDIPYSIKSPFVRAVSQIARTKIVDIDELAKRIRRNLGIMKRKQYTLNYLGILTEVYNYRSSPKIDFATEVRNALDAERAKHAKNMVVARETKRKTARLVPTGFPADNKRAPL
jgi:hypothetical protein